MSFLDPLSNIARNLWKKTNMYSIVEFHDGIFAIPTIWLSADKKRS